ncbi:MAG TPA: D-glycero-beta-D-manno-heptose 1,7-bisphosphate 7-phosphatase [Methylophilus sp.]|nr:D-glycero-beta-D-manno-heptose 1,7-bisphosphate 7-phosphatase [Methylophilus sp.]HQQ33262.1 D-glycero-beta-D-manno-heptose 1,7-bisphosphate 7-phosphatase [Methylophilus sp.]
MKLVILDRDGVINEDSGNFIKNPEEWVPVPGSLEAIALLNQSGYRVAVATNQSGVGRGIYDMATLNAIHDKMQRALAQVGGRIDAIFYCPHTADDHCNCRKPKTGMMEDISRRFSINLHGTYGIGDAQRDIQAFADSGCKTILVKTGKGKETLAQGNLPPGTQVVADLAEAVQLILAENE